MMASSLLSVMLLNNGYSQDKMIISSYVPVDVYCAEAYEEKFARIDKNRPWRDVGEIALMGAFMAGATVVGIGIMGGTSAFLVATIGGGTFAFPLLGGWAGYAAHSSIDREYSLMKAYEVQMLSHISVLELNKLQQGARPDNAIDELMKLIKLNKNDENYELVRSKILNLVTDDTFCPENKKGKPLDFLKLRKIVQQSL
jgi:hypothetical protein